MEKGLSKIRYDTNFKYINMIQFYGDENPYIIVKHLSSILSKKLNVPEYIPPNMIRNEYVDVDHLAYVGNLMINFINNEYINENTVNNLDINLNNEINNIYQRKEYYKELYNELKNKTYNIEEDEKYIKLMNEFNEYKENNERYIDSNEYMEDITNNEEYINLYNENEKLKKQLNDNNKDHEILELKKNIQILEQKINTKPNEEEIEAKYKRIYEEKILKYTKLNSSIKVDKNETKNSDKNKSKFPQNEGNVLKKYPITVYTDIGESIVKKMVASKCAYLVKYQYEIAEKTNRLENDISLDETIDYIIKQEKLSSQQKTKLKYEFERCVFLHKNYKDKLNCLKFSLRDLRHMSAKEWIKWLDGLNNILKNVYKDEDIKDLEHNICKYKFKRGNKKGQECGKINCKNKKHTEIH